MRLTRSASSGGGFPVIVARAGHRAGRENPRGKDLPDDDANASPFAEREFFIEGGLFGERIGRGDKEEIEIHEIEEARDCPEPVDACADRSDQPARLQVVRAR